MDSDFAFDWGCWNSRLTRDVIYRSFLSDGLVSAKECNTCFLKVMFPVAQWYERGTNNANAMVMSSIPGIVRS